jgi:hypothetical protein
MHRIFGTGTHSCGSGERLVVGSCECGNELLGSTKEGNFLTRRETVISQRELCSVFYVFCAKNIELHVRVIK